MQNLGCTLEVLVNGKPITEYRHEGKVYVEGRNKSEFSLKIRNNTWQRKEFVVSVDGLSVINGKPAGNSSTGYVVNAYSEVVIPGWLMDDKTAAKFFFQVNGRGKTYTEEVGEDSNNNGVIGVRIFNEYVRPAPVYRRHTLLPDPWETVWPTPRYDYLNGPYYGTPIGATAKGIGDLTQSINYASSSVGAASASLGSTVRSLAASEPTVEYQAQNLGAGFGEDTTFNTTKVEFERGSKLADLVIYYDDVRGLKARGVEIVKPKIKTLAGANPFPGDYCKRPRR